LITNPRVSTNIRNQQLAKIFQLWEREGRCLILLLNGKMNVKDLENWIGSTPLCTNYT